jgi:hypothetical protein
VRPKKRKPISPARFTIDLEDKSLLESRPDGCSLNNSCKRENGLTGGA